MASVSGGRGKEPGFPGDEWGLAEEKQLCNDLEVEGLGMRQKWKES